MMKNTRLFAVITLLSAATLLAGCSRSQEPEIRFLSEQEAEDIWSRAESVEPVGELSVREVAGDEGTTRVSSQAFRLMIPNQPPMITVTACSGSCKLTPGSTFDACRTSGCSPARNGCTPLTCSGGCTLSRACSAMSNIGIVAY